MTTSALKGIIEKNIGGVRVADRWARNRYDKVAEHLQELFNTPAQPEKVTKSTPVPDDVIAEIETITILDKDEFEKYKPLIRSLNRRWWLKSPGLNEWFMQVVFSDEDRNNVRNASGDHITASRYVRPSLWINLPMNDPRIFYKPEKLIGQKIRFRGYVWTVLDVNNDAWYILCDTTLGAVQYNVQAVDWENSNLKYWLETVGMNYLKLVK